LSPLTKSPVPDTRRLGSSSDLRLFVINDGSNNRRIAQAPGVAGYQELCGLLRGFNGKAFLSVVLQHRPRGFEAAVFMLNLPSGLWSASTWLRFDTDLFVSSRTSSDNCHSHAVFRWAAGTYSGRRFGGALVFVPELTNATSRVYQFLLSGKKRVAR